jgi:hypothetical protein
MRDAILHAKPYQADTAQRQRVAKVLQDAMLTVEARAVRSPVPAVDRHLKPGLALSVASKRLGVAQPGI